MTEANDVPTTQEIDVFMWTIANRINDIIIAYKILDKPKLKHHIYAWMMIRDAVLKNFTDYNNLIKGILVNAEINKEMGKK